MNPKWIMFFMFTYICFQLLGNMAEAIWFTPAQLADVNTLARTYVSTDAVGGLASLISVPVEWGKTIWKVLAWDYAFLTGEWAILRWLLFSFSAGFIWGAIQLIRGTSS